MSHCINANKIILKEQKRNASNIYGTINQFFINKMVMDNVKLKQLNTSTVWIDYKKIFDSVLLDWIIETLKIHKCRPIATKFIRKKMKKMLYLTKMVKLKPGIFQSILTSFNKISCQVYLSYYRYFHYLDIELIPKVILFHISCLWKILNSALQETFNLHQ